MPTIVQLISIVSGVLIAASHLFPKQIHPRPLNSQGDLVGESIRKILLKAPQAEDELMSTLGRIVQCNRDAESVFRVSG